MNILKLREILSTLTLHLDESKIPFAAMGAIALGTYGLPRFTADIDLLTDNSRRVAVLKILDEMGFSCFLETEAFAQLDSELGRYGKVDLLFVDTPAGKDILDRRVRVTDDLLGEIPVVQPSDYIILKLMAAANDPSRQARDEGDVASLLKHIRGENLSDLFEPVQRERILEYARRFGLEKRMKQIFLENLDTETRKDRFML